MPESTPRNHIYGYTVLVFSALIWGTEAILVKLCYSGGFTVISLLSLRCAVSIPILMLLVKSRDEPFLPPRRHLPQLLLLSANVLVGAAMLFLALDLLPATLGVLFFYAYPAFTSLLQLLLKRGPLGAPRLAALLISALGLVLLYWSSVAGLSLLGVACALCSAALQAGKLFQTAAALKHLSAVRLNLFTATTTTLAAGLFYLVQSVIGGSWGLSSITGLGWLFMLALGMGVSVFGGLFMTIGIDKVGAVDTALVLLLEPLTTAVLAFYIFGDTLSPWQLLGGLLILLAVALPAVANLWFTKKTLGLERR